jgi:hypothetical protein
MKNMGAIITVDNKSILRYDYQCLLQLFGCASVPRVSDFSLPLPLGFWRLTDVGAAGLSGLEQQQLQRCWRFASGQQHWPASPCSLVSLSGTLSEQITTRVFGGVSDQI